MTIFSGPQSQTKTLRHRQHFFPFDFGSALLLLALFSAMLLGSVACRDSKVTAYRIPKENDGPIPAGGSGPVAPFAVAAPSGAGLAWTAPARWKPKAVSALRKASYSIGDSPGASADVSITAFPGDVGGDLANINRWRGQLQLPPISEGELGPALASIEANGLTMRVVDLAGGPAEQPERMLGAIVPYDGATWFFKLSGPDALVAGEKATFVEFLRTVRAAPGAAAETTGLPPALPMASAVVPAADGPELKWTAPPEWQSKAPSAMRKATYLVAGDDGTRAELSVTAFPGSVGGELANVNRWRGQLQLPPIADAELEEAVARKKINGLDVTLVDLTGGAAGQPVRLLGAIVPVNGANWFFKFTGPATLVAREKSSFLALVQSLHAP
jgi:hypothetical protein